MDISDAINIKLLAETGSSDFVKNVSIINDSGMSAMEGITAILIVFMVIVMPVWIFFHYIAKLRTNRGLTSEDEKMLVELWDTANRMEQRIESLEVILDSQVPEWRNSHEEK